MTNESSLENKELNSSKTHGNLKVIHLRCVHNLKRNTSVPSLKTILFYFILFYFMLNIPALLDIRETEVRVQKSEPKEKFSHISCKTSVQYNIHKFHAVPFV